MNTNRPNGDVGDINEELLLARVMKQAGSRVEPPEDSRAWVYDRVLSDWEDQQQTKRNKASQPVWWAVAATVLVGLSLWVWQSLSVDVPGLEVATATRIDGLVEYSLDGAGGDGWLPLQVGTGITSAVTIRTGGNARIAITSETGASIRMDHGSELRIGSREVLDLYAGAVYIDSDERAASNIVVQTPFGRVQEVGTQFEVRLASDASTLKVRDGSVAFGADQLAVKGEVITMTTRESLVTGNVTTNAADWQWTQAVAPAFTGDRKTVLAFVEWVGRETGLTIQWSNEARVIAGESLDGQVPGRTPLEALFLYVQTTSLEYSVEGDSLVITVAE